MDPELRAMFQKVTKGALSGKAGETAERGIQGQRPVRQHARTRASSAFRSSTRYVEKAALDFLDQARASRRKPFFMNINFMKVHQPNMPHPDFVA